MTIRKLVNRGLLALFLPWVISCASIHADGVWIGAYSKSENEFPSVMKSVIEIKRNKMKSKTLYLPVQSSDSTTKKIRIRKPLSITKYSEDSLGLSYTVNENNSSYMFKRIPSDSYGKEIYDHDLINQAFIVSTKYYKDTLEFFRDETYFEARNYSNYGDYWMIRKFGDYKFLVIGQLTKTPLIPIINSKDQLTFHSLFTKDVIVDFRKVIEKFDTTGLKGDWIEVKTIFQDPNMPERPYRIQVTISSKFVDIDREEEPFSWRLSPSGKYIVFQHELRPYDMRDKAWKILKLTSNQLIIERSSTGIAEKEIVEFKRAE